MVLSSATASATDMIDAAARESAAKASGSTSPTSPSVESDDASTTNNADPRAAEFAARRAAIMNTTYDTNSDSEASLHDDTTDKSNEQPPEDDRRLASVQSYVEDQSKVKPKKKLAYILMLAKEVVDGFEDPGSFYPYSVFMEKPRKSFPVTSFKFTNTMIGIEITRRDPTQKPNAKNRTQAELLGTLRKIPLSNPEDIEYIKAEELKFRNTFTAQLVGEEEEQAEKSGRLTSTDRLRFISLFVTDDIKEAYLVSQRCKDRTELDYSNSEKAAVEWYDLLVELFNDAGYEVQTVVVSNLHDEFEVSIDCPKGAYELTPTKCKELLQDFKTKLRDMIKRYNASGNGSDMMVCDYDSDDARVVEENEETYGRFNSGRAKKRAEAKGDQALILKNGDDRQAFLRHYPVDLLYVWHIMDVHNLLFFTAAKLDEDNSASSSRPAGKTSRKSVGTDGKTPKKGKLSESEQKQLEVQTKMSDNVGEMSKSMASVAYANIAQQKSRLEEQRFEYDLKLLRAEDDNDERMVRRNPSCSNFDLMFDSSNA